MIAPRLLTGDFVWLFDRPDEDGYSQPGDHRVAVVVDPVAYQLDDGVVVALAEEPRSKEFWFLTADQKDVHLEMIGG